MSEAVQAVNTSAASTAAPSASKSAPIVDFMSLIAALGQDTDGMEELFAGLANDSDEFDELMAAEMLAAMLASRAPTDILLVDPENPEQPASALAVGGNAKLLAEAVKPAEDTKPQTAPEIEFEVVSAPAPAEESTPGSGEKLLEDHRFSEAVLKAQKEMKPIKKQEVDVEKLQADVNIGRFLNIERTSAGSAKSLEAAILEQVKDAVLQGVEQKNDNFTIRLSPEGLGDITIKMTEKEGRILLSIAASDSEAASAISKNAGALQNSLKPLQAEVIEVTVAPAASRTMTEFGNEKSFEQRNGQNSGTKQDNTRVNFGRPAQSDPEPGASDGGETKVYI